MALKSNLWKKIIQLAITVLTAIGGFIGGATLTGMALLVGVNMGL